MKRGWKLGLGIVLVVVGIFASVWLSSGLMNGAFVDIFGLAGFFISIVLIIAGVVMTAQALFSILRKNSSPRARKR